jgi:hypothetical protein
LREKLWQIEAEIAEEAGAQAAERFEEVTLPTGLEAVGKITAWLNRHEQSHWTACIEAVAKGFIPRT